MVERKWYVDVNIFIYWIGGHPKYGDNSIRWIRKMEEGKDIFITSTLTIYETLVILAGLTGRNLADKDFVNNILTSLTSLRSLKYIPLKSEDYLNAIEYISKFRLDLEDAIHYSVAKRNNINNIISNDEDFDRTDLKRVF